MHIEYLFKAGPRLIDAYVQSKQDIEFASRFLSRMFKYLDASSSKQLCRPIWHHQEPLYGFFHAQLEIVKYEEFCNNW